MTNRSSKADRIAGRSSGKVTLPKTWAKLPPDISAASSMRTSSTRRAGPSAR
jgi:hypothetical protein